MHRTSPFSFAALTVVVAMAASCKRKVSSEAEAEGIAALRAIKDQACACQEAACRATVQQQLTAWASGAGAALANAPASEELVVLSHQLTSCLASLDRTLASTPDAGVAPDAGPTLPAAPSTIAAPYPADALLRAAREWLAAVHPKLVPAQATLAYVDRDGNLDAEHGRFELQVGYVSEKVDDPRRRTGAPVAVADRPSDCPKLVWQAGAWDVRSWSCREVLPHIARCPTTTLWERAIGKGAPADALAVITLEYRDKSSRPRWAFAISDDLRGVKIRHAFEDDCPLTVEQAP